MGAPPHTQTIAAKHVRDNGQQVGPGVKDVNESWQQGHSMLGSMTCWATPRIQCEPEQTQRCVMTIVKQKERVGGSLVVHLASAVVEAVPGCVTPAGL